MKKWWAVLLTLAVVCCTRPDTPVPTPEPEPEPEPVTPVEPEKPEVEAKPRYVWIDASANFYYYANDKAYIAKELKQVADSGFTDIVVDVRPTEGTVLWESAVAPQANRLAAWVGSSYRFIERTASFDYLQAFIDAGHAAGLRVHAAINTFVGGYGGYYGLESEGPIFSGDIPAEWASMDNKADGLKSAYYEGVQGTVFLNPAHDEVQAYLLSLLKELAAYEVDGIVLDRCRYSDAGLQSDFSEISHRKFVAYLGHEPAKWPVFEAGTSDVPTAMGKDQYAWLTFRVKTIHDFVEKAAETVHSVNPAIRFGVYVGAWYSSYYPSGVNWASPRYQTHKAYPRWADSEYHKYGFADHCDFLLLGCYAAASSIYGTTEWTMQGFCTRARSLLMGDTVFAGGPDVGNPEGWQNGGKSAYIPKTVDACINAADGYFVFDLCHIRMFNYWTPFKNAFSNYLNTLTN